MRDLPRIDRVLGLLRLYWETNPDLRLGQIVVNLTPERFKVSALDCPIGSQKRTLVSFPDPFSVEDDEWEKVLTDAITKV